MALVSDDRLPGIIIPSECETHSTSQVTPLMLAAYHGNIENVLTLLKENQQCIMSQNVFGQTALHYAIDNGQINVIDTLVAFDADLDEVDSNGQTILHRCALYGSMAKVETCLNIGIHINAFDLNGNTALAIAAQRGHMEIVKLLVEGGSDTSIRNNEGLNATDCAFCNNHKEVLSFLLNKEMMPIDNSLQYKMLHECSHGNIESVKHLIDAYGEAIVNFIGEYYNYESPLLLACKMGHLALAQLLRQNKANINSQTNRSFTPLMGAVYKVQIHILEWLIAQGVRMNYRMTENASALHFAIFTGSMPIVKLLVENGSLLNLHLTNSYTALHIAVQEQHLNILDYLLHKGALPDVTLNHGVTPLMKAVQSKNMALVECLIKYGACVNKCDNDINTPLSVAVTENSLDMVRYLIEKGADVNINHQNRLSLKDIACSLGYDDIASYLANLNPSKVHLDERFYKNVPNAQDHLIKMCQTGKGTRNQLDHFIRAGANVNGTDIDGRTPLIVATQSCSNQCVQWLLEKKVCVVTKDKQSFTAIQYAVENEDIDLVGLLLGASPESISYEQTERILESAIKHCIKLNSSASVCITKMLLTHCAFKRLKGNCRSSLLRKCITFENVAIAELLFNYQLYFDSFEPFIVTVSCMSSNVDMLQCLAKYISNSRHRHFYIKLTARFCLANQLDQALCIVINKWFTAEEIFWTDNQRFWCGSENDVFKITMEYVVDKDLDIDTQNVNGCTFLMYAASMGMTEEVKYILRKGGEIHMVNKDGKDALDMALNAGHYETTMLMTDKSLVISGILNAHIHNHKLK